MTTKNKTQYTLKLEKRDIVGKKVNQLRNQGKIPANIYGEDFKSISVSADAIDFIKLYRQTGETAVLNLKLDKSEIPAIIHQVQKHPVSDNILHIDFRKVNLTKKIETEVPIKIIGQAEPIKTNTGVLLILSDSLKIEALPNDIPEKIEIDISKLKIDDEIKVKDIKTDNNFTFVEEADKTIVRISQHKEESVEPETKVEVAEAPEKEAEEKPVEEKENQQDEKAEDKKEGKKSEDQKQEKSVEDKKS